MPAEVMVPSSIYTGTGYPANALGSIIQSPKIDSSGTPTQKSIRDAGQGRDIIKTVIMAGRNRQIVNSRILAKYNAERPYDSYKLEAEGLGWRSNFTTKPLPLMIEKVAPRFSTALEGLKYFTSARLSNKWQRASEKSEIFQREVTKTIRARKGWSTLVEDIAFDNAIFGHTIVAWLDEFSWFPKHFKQDESFVSDGTKSDSFRSQIVVLKEVYLPHELFDLVKDGEAAKDAGWKLQNAYDAINRASPVQIRDRLNVGGTLETWYQNALRELTIGASYMAGASVIVVYTLLAREVDGSVSHYRFAGPEMLEIFSRENRFPSMEDCLTFFSFQKGNGTLHGSKGVGRDIYEMAGMLDRTRNEAVDRMIMSGKTIFQGDIKRIHTFKMSVIGSMVIIPQGWVMLESKLQGNAEDFIRLDAYFTRLIDQLVGSTSPPQPEGGEAMRSPAAWNVLVQREEEGKDVRIIRFLNQFVDLIGTMTKRLCDKDTSEDDAKELQRCLLESMTQEEIDELAEQKASGTVRDLTPMQRQLIASIVQEKKGNPLYNQKQLEVEDLTARANTEFADRVLLVDADPTEKAEQVRMQQLELVLLSHGQAVPVSPRDGHLIHLQVMLPAAEQTAQQLQQGQFSTDVLESMLAHIQEHYNQAVMKGEDKNALKPIAEFVKRIGPTLQKLQLVDQQAAQVSQVHNAAASQGHLDHPLDQLSGGGGPPQAAPVAPQQAAPPQVQP